MSDNIWVVKKVKSWKDTHWDPIPMVSLHENYQVFPIIYKQRAISLIKHLAILWILKNMGLTWGWLNK